MSGYPPPDVSDDIPPELAQVRNIVACELDAQLNLRGEAILLEDVCEVAYAIALRLGRHLRIGRALAQQEGLADDELLGLDSAAFYGSVMPCDNDETPSDRYPIFDYRWPSLSAPAKHCN